MFKLIQLIIPSWIAENIDLSRSLFGANRRLTVVDFEEAYYAISPKSSTCTASLEIICDGLS